ncbi:hypothetical protein LTR64_006087 [Lithohypha guttulata]|uniref:uncharacterized protein n=1 Tax=Lithohypha guttulata TaxID=1690604 RepID=UPI002DDF4A68|nr:hypothetical protein LTR51_002115 [Lithohypha guttulata]
MGNPYVKRHAGSASYIRSSEFRHPLLMSSYNKVDADANTFKQPSTHEATGSDQITTIPQRVPSDTDRESAIGLASDTDVQQREHVPEYDHQYLCIRSSNVFERFGNLGVASAIYTNNYPADIQTRQLLVLQKEEWATPCLTFYDDSPLARLYDNFRKVSMEHIAGGMSVASILGREDEINVELLFRDRSSEDDLDVSNFACDVWRNILGQQDVYVVLAMTAMTARLARWMLIPSIQTWHQIPAIARPFPSQKLIPHNPSIDFCAHPIARQSLMNHYSDWISAGEQGNICVSWPHTFDRAIFKHPGTGQRHISKEFERHISDHRVWNWTNDVLKTMPCMEDLGAVIR